TDEFSCGGIDIKQDFASGGLSCRLRLPRGLWPFNHDGTCSRQSILQFPVNNPRCVVHEAHCSFDKSYRKQSSICTNLRRQNVLSTILNLYLSQSTLCTDPPLPTVTCTTSTAGSAPPSSRSSQ